LFSHKVYEVTVDSKFQYGQSNKEGLGRWLVYHDKEHKMYQVHAVITPGCVDIANDWTPIVAPIRGDNHTDESGQLGRLGYKAAPPE
jgi:hypothetical protein